MGQHHSCGGYTQQMDASAGKSGEQVHDVVVVDEGVRHLDERSHYLRFSGHVCSSPEHRAPDGQLRPITLAMVALGFGPAPAEPCRGYPSLSLRAMTSCATSASRRSLLKA